MSSISPNIVIPWIGLHANIPSLWTRETSLDAKFTKAWGTANPGNTGGASAHSHTGNIHTHTMTAHSHTLSLATDTQNQDAKSGGPGWDEAARNHHGHSTATISTITGGNASDTIAYPSTANNNHPPYYEVIFIKATAGAVLPNNGILFWNSTTIPLNYLTCTDGSNGAPALGNKYLRGAGTGANSGTTGGSLTHTHDLSHSHSTVHSHFGQSGSADSTVWINTQGGSNQSRNHSHDITLNNATVSTDTYSATLTSNTIEPSYKKLLAILKQTGGALVKGSIAMWLGNVADIPAPWLLCNDSVWSDGVTHTPDLRNLFVKIANSTGEIGNTGGGNTHDHPTSNAHSHTGASHNHTATVGWYSPNMGGSGGGNTDAQKDHSHNPNSVSSTTLAWGSTSMSAESVNNEPDHVVVAYIQLTKDLGGGAMQMNMMS